MGNVYKFLVKKTKSICDLFENEKIKVKAVKPHKLKKKIRGVANYRKRN